MLVIVEDIYYAENTYLVVLFKSNIPAIRVYVYTWYAKYQVHLPFDVYTCTRWIKCIVYVPNTFLGEGGANVFIRLIDVSSDEKYIIVSIKRVCMFRKCVIKHHWRGGRNSFVRPIMSWVRIEWIKIYIPYFLSSGKYYDTCNSMKSSNL